MSHPHVVIIGGGFGGLEAARALAGAPDYWRRTVTQALIALRVSESTSMSGYVRASRVTAEEPRVREDWKERLYNLRA